MLIEAINRLAAITALPDEDIGAALDFEIDADHDIGDFVYQLRQHVVALVGPIEAEAL